MIITEKGALPLGCNHSGMLKSGNLHLPSGEEARTGPEHERGKRPRTPESGRPGSKAERQAKRTKRVNEMVEEAAKRVVKGSRGAIASQEAARSVVRDALSAPTGPTAARNKVARKKHDDRAKAVADLVRTERGAEAIGKFSRGAGASRRDLKDKKLRAELRRKDQQAASAAVSSARAEILQTESSGVLEAEGPMERTWKVDQAQIKGAVDVASARKALDLRLDSHGPYLVRYGRNGRHMLLCGRGGGHIAVVDAVLGKPKGEFVVEEACFDACLMHSDELVAVAQRTFVHIYDRSGTEIHVLRDHRETRAMAYLPYHQLLATIGTAGWLKYKDISTGRLVSQHRSKMGPCSVLALNPFNSVVISGHSNGVVSMWTPNMPDPVVKVLAHRGPVTAVAVDPSGTFMVTSGADARMRVWDLRGSSAASSAAASAIMGEAGEDADPFARGAIAGESLASRAPASSATYGGLTRAFGLVHDYFTARPASSLDVSQRGMLACSFGPHVQVWKDALVHKAAAPYLRHMVPGQEVYSVRFRPFEDVLGLGHTGGAQTLLVPGAGEPHTDTRAGLDPHESLRMRRDRDVREALDKLLPETIALNPDSIGGVDRAPADVLLEERRADAEEAEMTRLGKERVKKGKSRGRSHSTRARAKRQANVITRAKQMMEEKLDRERKAKAARGHEGAAQETDKDAPATRALKRFF
jgi:U3 small nucleolar RNA-associated protein 7